MVYSILHADDHPIMRLGITHMINKLSGYSIINEEISNGKHAILVAERLKPDILILDIDMPKVNGLQVVQYFSKMETSMKIILLSGLINENVIKQAQALNVLGFLSKITAIEEIQDCLLAITKNQSYISRDLLYLTKGYHEINTEEDLVLEGLTLKEKHVLGYIIKGRTTKEIANELNNSPRTIDAHRHNICRKLNIKGQSALMAYAMQHKTYLESQLG